RIPAGCCHPRPAGRVCPPTGSRLHPSLPAEHRTESARYMKPRTTSRLAWSIGLATIALMVGALVLMFVDRHAALPSGATRWRFSDVLFEVAVVGVPAVVGILLAARRPEN